jgi:hypothetical protein
VAAAIAIINEATNTPLHGQRMSLARQVLQAPAASAATMAAGIVADGTTNNSSSDAQIDARVSAVWNAYAQ